MEFRYDSIDNENGNFSFFNALFSNSFFLTNTSKRKTDAILLFSLKKPP